MFALTSPSPASTLPPCNGANNLLPPYPAQLSKTLSLRLFPLDITLRHNLSRGQFRQIVTPRAEAGSPLAEWVSAFMTHTFQTLEALHPGHVGDNAQLSLHDPLCVWYALTATATATDADAKDPASISSNSTGWGASRTSPEDIRVETQGQWTRGMCVVDRRNRHRADHETESSSDHGLWLSVRAGNRIWRMDRSPVEQTFGQVLLQRLFI